MASIDWTTFAILLPAGVLAGIVNTVAGGGSFITLPALLLVGLPVTVANGTNRVAIVLQSMTASSVFVRGGQVDLRATFRILAPTLVGAIAGARLASMLEESLFRQIFGALFLLMVVVLAFKPRLMLDAGERSRRPVLEVLAFVGIGLYGGFIQAGVGVFMLVAMTALSGVDLLRANAIKNLLVVLYSIPVLAIFAHAGQVDWVPGLILAAGNMVGGYIGARLAIAKGNRLIFAALLVVMVLTGLKLLTAR